VVIYPAAVNGDMTP